MISKYSAAYASHLKDCIQNGTKFSVIEKRKLESSGAFKVMLKETHTDGKVQFVVWNTLHGRNGIICPDYQTAREEFHKGY